MITTVEYNMAVAGNKDEWVPACGGVETPFTVRGKCLHYCFNPAQMKHAYLDVDNDIILTDEEAARYLP